MTDGYKTINFNSIASTAFESRISVVENSKYMPIASPRSPKRKLYNSSKDSSEYSPSMSFKINIEKRKSAGRKISSTLINNQNSKAEQINKDEVKSKSKKRRDYSGSEIKKGGKKHKVTFRDKISNQEFFDIVEIMSYKIFNEDISQKKKSLCANCRCVIY
jgi:hypothetical protein